MGVERVTYLIATCDEAISPHCQGMEDSVRTLAELRQWGWKVRWETAICLECVWEIEAGVEPITPLGKLLMRRKVKA